MGEPQLVDETGIVLGERVHREPPLLARPLAKPRYRRWIEVVQRHPRIRHPVPAPAGLPEQEAVEGGASEDLVRASATLVVDAAVAGRHGVRFDDDPKVEDTVILANVHGGDDAEEVAELVRQFLQQTPALPGTDADDPAFVVAADLQRAAIRVREGAHRFQVVVTPGGFPLKVLSFA